MRNYAFAIALSLSLAAPAGAQTPHPFKLGTVTHEGRTGQVLVDCSDATYILIAVNGKAVPSDRLKWTRFNPDEKADRLIFYRACGVAI